MKPNLIYISYLSKLGALPKPIKFSQYLEDSDRKDLVMEVRRGNAEKMWLPAIIVTGVFRKDSSAESFVRGSGFASFDIDYMKSEEELQQIKEHLKTLPYVYYLSKSVSGRGLWGMVKFKDISQFVFQYSGLIEEFQEMGIQLDISGANINRLRFYTWDEDEYLNVNVKPFTRFGNTLQAKSSMVVDFSVDHKYRFRFSDRVRIKAFNENHQCEDLFEEAGWEVVGQNYSGQIDVLRPGSEKSRSGNIVRNKFWCFTSSTSFPANSLSEAFDCYVFLFHDGDVRKALKSI